MQITETSAEGLKHEFTVTVEAEDIARQVTQRLEELSRSVRLPGFRPGKVPMTLLRQRYGRSVMGEVLERAVNDSSAAAIKERNLRPALQPKVEIVNFDEGAALQYKMAVEVLPDIAPLNFAELKLERLKPEVPEEEVDKALERLAQGQRKQEKTERAADKGDVVVIDFAGTSEGNPIPGGSATDYALELGTGSFIPGFEDGLVGAAAGEQRTLDLAFPGDYGSAELAGKQVRFAVTVKEVRAVAAQPIDASLATAVGFDTLDELRKTVREQIERDYGRLARQKLKRELLDGLAAQHHFPVPEGMVEIEFNSIWKQVEDERKRQAEAAAASPPTPAEPGTETKDAPAEIPSETDDEKMKAEYRAIAERRVRLGLLLAEVGRANSITVTQDEINRALMEQARRFPGQERQVVDYYRNNPAMLDSLRAPIYEDKVVDFIVELAQVTERAVPPRELIAATEALDEDETTTKSDEPPPA
ncbi:MAG TPA: trigger factor [Stellaceae bacterium]|nr:trigger factor [Stellaceae bacterium]